jgi:diguanylate cyclase (GGDEF)-like protein
MSVQVFARGHGRQAVAMGDGRPKILVVDDTPANLIAMRHLLSRTGAEIIEARSGNDALAACIDHEFALILLDVQMPDMDGFEVAALLAEEQKTHDTPVIFVTAAYADDMDRLRGYRIGAVDYIAKPVNDTILLSKVQVFLELQRGRRDMQQLLRVLNERNRELENEIAERQRAEALVRHRAAHDALTGLPNRHLFMDRLAEALSATGTPGRCALLYIDLDGFKPVNDDHGHHVGDLLLQAIAARLKNLVREGDTVARLGGDEFAVILGDSAELPAEALAVAARLGEALREEYALSPGDGARLRIRVGASIGISLSPDHAGGSDPRESMIRAADKAMYLAKHGGKGATMVASSEA